jgi:predicted metal-dependent HD superfamily phosphohydrolase
MSVTARDTITELRKLPAIEEALLLLHTRLPQNLTYHAYAHTEDVLAEAVTLALSDNLAARDVEIVALAAAWHDVGFIHSMQRNEPLAAAALRASVTVQAAYTLEEISLVEKMILDTALIPFNRSFRQLASTPLSRYLLDADLANFGREDFFVKSELLRQELGEDTASFRVKTLALFENHEWLTPAAKRLWTASKQQNVLKLQELISARAPEQ